MDVLTIEKKWSEIKLNSASDYRSIRISQDCACELFISFNNELKRCLILSVGKTSGIDFNDDIKEYVSIEYYDLSGHVIITLLDDKFKELFNAFIISLYQRVKSISNAFVAAREMVKVYYEWCQFFNEKAHDKLTLGEVMGLYGELFILLKLLKESDSTHIDNVLASWTGPYGKGHDFILDTYNIEVKTKEFTKLDVIISSEFQLEPEFAKGLHLKVIPVELNVVGSKSLSDLVDEISYEVTNRLGNIALLLKALGRKGITPNNVTEYDNYRFKVTSEISFDCLQEGFPKLTTSNIPKQISTLKYNLRITSLDEYILEQTSY